jgi:hypothetical protein
MMGSSAIGSLKGFVVSTRGGDFDLHIGQDVSIGYLNHTDAAVRLYLQETFMFLLLTAEAAIALAQPTKAYASRGIADQQERCRMEFGRRSHRLDTKPRR